MIYDQTAENLLFCWRSQSWNKNSLPLLLPKQLSLKQQRRSSYCFGSSFSVVLCSKESGGTAVKEGAITLQKGCAVVWRAWKKTFVEEGSHVSLSIVTTDLKCYYFGVYLFVLLTAPVLFCGDWFSPGDRGSQWLRIAPPNVCGVSRLLAGNYLSGSHQSRSWVMLHKSIDMCYCLKTIIAIQMCWISVKYFKRW